MYKKSISPVVAVALLLIVSVIAVIGYQGWFSTYSSKIFSDTEIKSNSAISSVKINNLVGNKLFLLNPQKNITIKTIKLDNYDCNITESTYTDSLIEITIPDFCLGNITTNTPYVTVITNEEILDYKVFLKGDIISSTGSVSSPLNCSDLGLNGGEWVTVPSDGPGSLVSEPFCVMKYEAKFVSTTSKTQDGTYRGWRYDNAGGDLNITSLPTPEPITHISQNQAKSACQNLGSNYQLITNAQWTTIARNAENNSLNWDSGIIGTGSMFRGHSDSSPDYVLPVSDSMNFYDGTGNSGTSIQRRVFILNNSEVIWDLSGNLWEWNSDNCIQNSPWYTTGWIEWTNANLGGLGQEKDLAGPIGAYTSSNAAGQYYGCNANNNAFLRGGRWTYSAIVNPGAYALYLGVDSSFINEGYGFRCTYTP